MRVSNRRICMKFLSAMIILDKSSIYIECWEL
jgi:hypothetical protein